YPVLSVVRRHPRELLLTFGLFSATSGSFYIFATFIPAYGTTTLKVSHQALTNGLLIFAVVELFAVMFATRSTDRFGRKPLFIGCAVATTVVAYPLFLLVETRSAVAILLVMAIGGASVGIMYGIPGSMGPELFPPEVRYSGAGLAYQVSAAIVGGLTPVVTTAVAAAAGGTWPVALLLALMAVTGLVSALFCTETAKRRLRESQPRHTVEPAPTSR
ncbi:MAG: MFS transporter, partial [Pseudonocardia sp.]|nr:MFS transporter [Pseudonocardia sp.]